MDAEADWNWPVLDRLRSRFLQGLPQAASYWQDREDLVQYHLTFACRIGWKWEAVLGELADRRGLPPALPLVDWGCGTGIASLKLLTACPPGHFPEVRLWDRSSLAGEFAAGQIRAHPSAPPVAILPSHPPPVPPAEPFVLAVSHVWNELDPTGRDHLLAWVQAANAVLWVEPGTPAVARDLQAVRDRLRTSHRIVAPCTHAAPCGALLPGSEAHWCHHFAPVPAAAFQSRNWTRLSRQLGIDLRALPYTFQILESAAAPGGTRAWTDPVAGQDRIIGRPRVFKPCVRMDCCGPAGFREVERTRREQPDVWKAARKGRLPPFLPSAASDETLG